MFFVSGWLDTFLGPDPAKLNWDKSAASVCCQVAAWVTDIFCEFYLVKNCKIIYNLSTTELRKNKHRFGIFEIFEI